MSFDPNKFEAIHFSRKRNFDNVNIQLPPSPGAPYNAEPRIVKPTPNSAMRWLGVYFDSRLSFKCHAEKMASKGRKAVSGLNMLGNTVQGVEPYVMRQAVHACILPILTYAAPAWWPGKNRLDKKGKVIRNGVEGHLSRLNKVQNIALRTILPVWWTTPITIMQREAATPPIEHTLDHLCKLAAIQLHKLEPRHPLRLRTKNAQTKARFTRLEKLAKSCASYTQYSNPLLCAQPWETHLLGGIEKCLSATEGAEDKKVAAAKFQGWLQKLGSDKLVEYTDGSQKTDLVGNTIGTGTAWVLRWKGQWLGQNGFSLGRHAEVYDAEVMGICGGLEAVVTSPMIRAVSIIHICTDNLSVAQQAGTITNGSSQDGFRKFKQIAENWLSIERKISVQWVPAHMGKKGNDIADAEAKRYAGNLPNISATEEIQTLAYARRTARKMQDREWVNEWKKRGKSQALKSYHELGLEPTTRAKSMPKMALKREVLGWLIAARSGHGHFADYHERFGHEEEDIYL